MKKSVFIKGKWQLLICLFFISTIALPQAVPELVYYKFDAAGDQTNYASAPVGTNPAPILGVLSVGGTGEFGTALTSTGGTSSANYVNTGWPVNLTNPNGFTISMWMDNMPNSTSLYYLFGDNTATSFRSFVGGVAGAGNIILRGGGCSDIVITGISGGPHVVHFVWDGTNLLGYLDGVLQNTVPDASTDVTGTSGPFKIGGYSGSTGMPAGSLIDEFRIYDRALSAAEIALTWNQPLPLGPSVPTVTTTAVTAITGTSATSGGDVTDQGLDAVTARGVCWNTTGSPTIMDNITVDGTGTGVFTSNLTGLTTSTTYYVKAYATNSAGTGYGNEENFTTLACTNPTSGGTISADQSGCVSFDPVLLTSLAPPNGEIGTLEYKWQQSTTSSTADFSDIAGSNSDTYDPPTITVTTWYKRLARVDCMADWTGAAESNVLEITVYPEFIAGSISADQSICYNTIPALLNGTAPTGGSTPYSYQWQSSTDNVSFTDIPGAISLDYQPPALTSTTYYRLLQYPAFGCTPPQTITLGTSTVTQGYPYYTFYMDSRTQILYTAQEIIAAGGTAGDISWLAFDISSANTTSAMNGFNLRMKNTTATSVTDWDNNMTDVFSGTYTVPGTGWQQHSLTNPFMWDGVSNLLVEICFNNNSYTTNSYVRCTYNAGMTRHYHFDGSNNDGCLTTSGSSYSYRPNLRFDLSSTPVGIPTDTLTVTVQPLPVANAGIDATICENQTHLLSGSAANYQSTMWVSLGDGTFDDPTSLAATYTPGPGDILSGFATLQLTAYAIAPCTVDSTDYVNLTVIPLPTAYAGPDTAVCEGESIHLTGIAGNQQSIMWTTSGDGIFDDPTIETPIYTPGTNDIALGSAILTMTAYANTPCLVDSSDNMNLTIQWPPTVDAGIDDTICEDATVQLAGTATNYQSVLWTTSGDGSFNDATLLNPIYTPGSSDKINGGATLTLTAYAVTPCLVDASDDVQVVIQMLPTVSAGSDDAVCENASYTLSGSAANQQSVLWTTSGDGTFDNATLLNAAYTPGPGDITGGNVTLTITAYAIAPCGTDAAASMVLSIQLSPIANAGDDDAICENNAYTLSGSAINEQSVLWTTSGDGTFDDATLFNTTYTPGPNDLDNGSAILSLTAYAITPCANDHTDDMELSFQLIPIVNAGPDGETCPSDPYQLSGSAQYEDYTYWNAQGDGTFADPTDVNTTYTPGPQDIINGSVSIWLVAYPDPLCNVAEPMDEMILTILPAPVVEAGDDLVVMEGEEVQLNGSATGASGSYTYHWTPENMVTDPTIPNPMTLPVMTTTTFVLEATDNSNNCAGADSVTLFVETGMFYPISGNVYKNDDGNPFEGVHINFENIATPVVSGSDGAYTMDVPSGYSGHAVPTYPGYAFTPDTNYYANTGIPYSEQDYLGTLFLIATADPDTICLEPPQNSQLDVEVFSPVGTINYEWYDEQMNLIASTQALEVQPTESTLYTVYVQDDNYWSWDTVRVTVMICTGMGESESAVSITVYPVPTTDFTWVDIRGIYEPMVIQLLNIDGRPIRQIDIEPNNSDLKIKLDMEELPTGFYYLMFMDDKGEFIAGKKVVKVG